MATKTKLQSRTATTGLNKKSGFRFHWWMALILVAIIAVVGIAVLRFSHASGGWCDSQGQKMACTFAVDKLSTRDPSKVISSVNLVQQPDPETGLSGAEAYYLDSRGFGPGTLVYGGPNKSYSGLTNSAIKGCWWLRDTSGNAGINMVIKSNGSIIAQANGTVSGAYYNKYCISQTTKADNLYNVTFELRITNGSIRANRFLMTKPGQPGFK